MYLTLLTFFLVLCSFKVSILLIKFMICLLESLNHTSSAFVSQYSK